MQVTATNLWDALSRVKMNTDFTTADLVRKSGLEPNSSVSPLMTMLDRYGVLDQVGRNGKQLIWRRTEKQWRPGMPRVRPSALSKTSGTITRTRPSRGSHKKKDGGVVVANGAIHAMVEIRTEKFALLDDVREWLTAEGVEYTMQIVK